MKRKQATGQRFTAHGAAPPAVPKVWRDAHRGLYHLVKSLDCSAMRGVEVGVERGEMSLALLSAFPGLVLELVDRWGEVSQQHPYRSGGDPVAQLPDSEHARNLRETVLALEPFAGRYHLRIRESLVAAADLLRCYGAEWADFVYLDADHSHAAVLADCKAWWPLVRPGGLLCGHDYDQHRHRQVKPAVDEWASESRLTVTAHRGRIWCVRKPGR